MSLRAVGRITVVTAGTPVRATSLETDPTARYPAHAFLFQRDDNTETGNVYIMDREDGDPSTGVGVLAILAIPTENILPSFSATITYAPAGLNLADLWIDSDVNGEGCQVSAMRA